MPRLSKKLTDTVVRQAVHKTRRYELSDAGTGLVLRVEARPSSQKIWQVRYRTSAGQQRRMKLGAFPQMPLSDARARAAALRAEAQRGHDPGGSEDTSGADLTVGDFIDLFDKRHLSTLSSGTAQDYRLYLTRDVARAWSRRKLASITRSDVTELVARVAERAKSRGGIGVAGAMLRRILSKMFRCAVAWGYVHHNPVAGTMPPAKSQRRATRLAVEPGDGGRDVVGTLGALWHGLNSPTHKPETRAALQLCLVLGLRVLEAASLQRRHVDLAEHVVFVQGKGDKERKLPLPALAAAIITNQLERLKKSKIEGLWLFPQAREPQEHVTTSGLSHALREIADAVAMPELCTHDLRRTAATGLRALGTDRDVVKRILGHTDHDVTGTYVRAGLHVEMKKALEAWAKLIAASGKPKRPPRET
jgi:integrase